MQVVKKHFYNQKFSQTFQTLKKRGDVIYDYLRHFYAVKMIQKLKSSGITGNFAQTWQKKGSWERKVKISTTHAE